MLGAASTVTINNKHKWMALQRHMDFLDMGGRLPVRGNLITLKNGPHIHKHTRKGPATSPAQATWFGAPGYSDGNLISAD